jgi:hypothetical protein
MMVFQKSIPRRTFVRGVGASLALPLLDSMFPALARAQTTNSPAATRLSFFYVPNGITMGKWTPATEGASFELTPILKPLSAFRDRMIVLSGLDQNQGHSMPGENAGDHPRASATYLTCVHPKATNGADLRAGTSVDQIAAEQLGKQTQLASIELGIESAEILGSCESAYSCAYYNTICWRNPKAPLPMENNPRAVFERLFGDTESTSREARMLRIQEKRSVLDFVSRGVKRLLSDVSPADRIKVDQYLEAVRDVERRIQMAESQSSHELPSLLRPAGIPPTFTEHIKLLLDMEVLAYQSDLTRVCSLMVGHEMGLQAYPELGFADPYHPLTHHNGDLEKVAKVIQIDVFHSTMFAYFLERLAATPHGGGSLLDHSLVVYGSGLSDGNLHLHDNLPVLLLAGKATRMAGGNHIRYPKGTPMANLYLTLLEQLGISIEGLGDSTGKLSIPYA